MPQLVGPLIDWWAFKLFAPLALEYCATINMCAHEFV